MKGWDINCDLGEGEPEAMTEGLCGVVGRINVACGGHAGDEDSMRRCVGLARRHGLRLGAHPGLPGEKGRGPGRIGVDELVGVVGEQVARLVTLTAGEGVKVGHVKLHGALYHLVEEEGELGWAMAELMRGSFRGMQVVGMPDRNLERMCRAAGVGFVREGFLDRGYRGDGRLIARGEVGALLEVEGVVARWGEWLRTGTIRLDGDQRLTLRVETWCIHGDTPGALEMVRGLELGAR
jgi:UPF0271 protein